MSFLHSDKAAKATLALLMALALAFTALPSDAADLESEITELRKEQEQVAEQEKVKAREVEVATATFDELSDALAVLTSEVNDQEVKLASAEAELELAEANFIEATGAVQQQQQQIDKLEDQVQEQAISAFVGNDEFHPNPLLNDVEPNAAVRRRQLVLSVTQQDIDLGESLKAAYEELAVQQAVADQAAKDAERVRAEIKEGLILLEAAKDEQASLTEEANARLDARLTELALLEEMGEELDSSIKSKSDELARQLAAAAARRAAAAGSSGPRPTYPSSDEIVKVGLFWVHEDIADNLQKLLNHAASDGITFKGWGYRDHQRQIELRRSHCGSSEYAIWRMPSSQCRPPTARPGFSQHEQGKAIDFTYNGASIGTRSSPGYKWLNAHAHKYGLYNLPSEPWHWSVNGR